jgi:phosphoenolpyruvate synthase/pyruvate phosphate dikinase
VREDLLRRVRERIESAPVPPSLITAARARIRELFPGTRVRLRSSTNAEDLPGFNGAGLYRSVVIDANADDRALEAALRAVWSSVWSFQAFEERAYFRIDQTRVAMAVLVQESIDDDVVDGVAITANPFNEGRPGLFINAQVAGAEGGAVTSARGDEVPEQVVYYTYGEEREFERLSRSTRTPNGQVLTDDEVFGLSQVLRAIHQHFNSNAGWSDGTPMDVEFILAGPARRVVIVQARPYPVRWDHDRGVAMPLEE